MTIPASLRQTPLILLLLFCAFSFAAFSPLPKQGGTIILKDEPLPITPKEFYVAGLTDERETRDAVAMLLAPPNPQNQPKTVAVDLQGGGFTAISRFIARNVPKNTALRPVVIKLKQFMATESALPGGRVQGHMITAMSFDLVPGDDDTVHLVDYKSAGSYTRSAGPPADIEPALRHMLQNGLVYLNTWMNREAGTNIKLAHDVKVKFSDFNEMPEGDTIYYAVNRPLTWDDFRSKIPSGRYEAEVYPTIGYDENTDVNNGIINVGLAIKVCLPKSACWVRPGMQNDDVLNHEQRHFDIVKIVAGHFKRKLNAEHLTAGNYDGIINFDYLEAYREMDQLQKQYDEETRHGSDLLAQARWNDRIEKELRLYGVKK